MIYEVELTNHCNMKCGFCPRSAITRPKGFLELQDMPRLLDHIAERPRNVHFTGMGEPFLHRDIVQIVKEVVESGSSRLTHITTNGTLATHDQLDQLCELGPVHFYLSHADPIHPPEVLEKFLPYKDRTDIVLVDSNISDVYSTRRRAERMGFRVGLMKCHNRGGYLDDGICDAPILDRRGKHCRVYSDIEFISWNMWLLSCCNDLKGENRLGVVGDIVDRSGPVDFDICEHCSTV